MGVSNFRSIIDVRFFNADTISFMNQTFIYRQFLKNLNIYSSAIKPVF